MGFDENGKPKFIDKQDRASFKKLLSFMKERGVKKFVMTIQDYNGGITTENQVNLWNFIKGFISDETGNDVKTIEETLNNTGKQVEDMTNQEFNSLLDYSFSVSKEYFNMNIHINKDGRLEQIHEKR